jgi:hypothetical protein
LDLYLAVLCDSPPLFFLSYSPISISCFVGIWDWRIWALVFLPLYWLHWWVLLRDSMVKVRWAYYSWVLETLDDLVNYWISWGPPIKLWRSSQGLWCIRSDFLGTSN